MLTCIFLSKILGPSIMKDRPAYNLKKTIMFYNLFQVLFSGYVFYEAGMAGWWTGYNWLCQDIDRAADPDSKGKLLKFILRDHPFKTSEFLRGHSVLNWR